MKNIINITINLLTKEPFPVGDLSPEELTMFASGAKNVYFRDHLYTRNDSDDTSLIEGKTPVRKLIYKA